MHLYRRLAPWLLGLLIIAGTAQAQASKDSLKSISYSALGQQVRSHKGKVIVVYFWSFG